MRKEVRDESVPGRVGEGRRSGTKVGGEEEKGEGL